MACGSAQKDLRRTSPWTLKDPPREPTITRSVMCQIRSYADCVDPKPASISACRLCIAAFIKHACNKCESCEHDQTEQAKHDASSGWGALPRGVPGQRKSRLLFCCSFSRCFFGWCVGCFFSGFCFFSFLIGTCLGSFAWCAFFRVGTVFLGQLACGFQHA